MRISEHQFHVAAEFPEDLPAGAAGRSEHVRVRRHGHATEVARAFRDGLEHGHALGAKSQSIGRVLDVATGMDAARRVFESCAYFESGEGRVRVMPGAQRGFDQRIHQLSRRGSSAFKNFTSVPRTASPVSSTSAWSIFCGSTPAAMLVTHEIPRTRMPMWLATMASGAVDMPTRSAPMVRRYRIPAGVS